MDAGGDYSVAARYRTIRKHLDSLGYRQALSLDALPLIEKLLADLIQTTDSLKHFKTIAQDNVEACSELQLSIDPYKCDNARLVQECNQLHSDLIEAKEAHQKQTKDLKRKIYTLESECNNLQLASSRNLKRIKQLETESAQKSKRIQELLGKCCKPLISNAALGSKKKPSYPLRRPSLESDPLPRIKANSSLPSLRKVEPGVVDLLAMADRKMNSLNHEVTALRAQLSIQTDNVYTLKSQLTVKEKENSRLKKMLEGGRPQSAVSKDCSCPKSDQYSEHNGYEKSLAPHTVCHRGSEASEQKMSQQVKLDLEQQLKEALDKQHDAMSQAMKLAERNEELEKELRDIDHIALAVEADCNSAVKENNKRVSYLQEKLENVMTQVHVLEGELMVERRSAQELRADLEAGRLENRNLQRKLESTLDEKKQMTDRINELTVIEHNLNDEIRKLCKDNENLTVEVSRMDCANDLLKKQMHDNDQSQSVSEPPRNVKEKAEKNDKNKGKALKRKKNPASRGQRRSFSPPVHEKEIDTMRRQGDSRDEEVTRDSNIEGTKRNVQKINNEKDSKINQLQSTIDQIQTDRDYYKNEYNRLREQCSKNADLNNAELWGQVCELRHQLIEKEHAVLELQREKKDLCREKFELELRLQSARSDRRNAANSCGQCRPVGSCACSASRSSSTGDSKAMLERMERERDTARADVDRLVEERDALRERLKGTQRAAIGGFEDQIDDLKEELRRTKQELTTQRTQYFQLRTLQDQADQALGDVQGQLSQTEAELYKTIDRNRSLEQQRLQLDNDVKGLKQEINTLRANVSRGEQEKEQILMQLNERNERIALLDRELKAKEQEVASVEKAYQELQQKNQLCVDQSAEQERRLRNMQMEMEINQRQLAAASNDRDNAAQENRRLQDDLAAVTCEIRTLQRELEVSRAESFDLKRQLQTYVSEVRRAEDLINRKENERTEMLNHFRSLSLEATVLENNNHSLESEAAEARGALQSARDRALDLERQLADRDCMIRGYETQITELTQAVASLETQIRQQIDQRQRTEADLNAVRDLCVKLDQQKECLVKELGDKEAMKAQYEAQIARLRAEQNMVQDQINRDHVTVERLETLLDQARQESMDSQSANQELQCEMSRLKQKMCDLQTKLSSESTELRRYQNQAAEYSKQISELRRQVTNERFDRARKDEEHRRMCLCGESGKSTRTDNFASESLPGNVQQRRLDCSSINVQSSPSPRYGQSGKTEEYLSRIDLRSEAQRTNRFDTSNLRRGSPSVICKCADSNGKMYNGTKPQSEISDVSHGTHAISNPDPSIVQADRDFAASTRNNDTSGYAGPTQETKCGGLCIRARLEEDADHKDIRVRISNSSACSQSNKTTVLKFCTPLVGEHSDTQYSSVNEAAGSSDKRRDSKLGSTQDRSLIEENMARHRVDQSSKIDQDSGTINGTIETSTKSRTNRLETLGASRKIIGFTNDDTSGYKTSESSRCCCSTFGKSSNNEPRVPEDTLREYLEHEASTSRERSRSLPRSRIDEKQLDCAKSNISFPVRVDYSEATLTAADLTRPEFVRMLTEVKEHTRNVEKELSRMNSAMRSSTLNGNPSDSLRFGSERNKARVSYDSIDRHYVPTSDVGDVENSNVLASLSSITGNSENATMNHKKKDKITASQDNVRLVERNSVSGTKISRKLRPELTRKSEESKCHCEGTDTDKRFSKNQFTGVDTRDQALTSTQSKVDRNTMFPDPVTTVDESVLVKPSKIHKLKKQAPPTSGQSTGIENKTCVDDPLSFPCANECLGLSRSPRRDSSPEQQTLAKRIAPKAHGDSERVTSSSTQSDDNRVVATTSIADALPTAPPTTPVDETHDSAIQRGRQPSRFSCIPCKFRGASKNKKNNSETRSRSVDSKNDASATDATLFHTANETTDPTVTSNQLSKTEQIKAHKIPTTPKPSASKSTEKSSKLGNLTKVRSASNDGDRPSRISSEITEPTDPPYKDNPPIPKKLKGEAGKLAERRTSGTEHSRGRSPSENRRGVSSVHPQKSASRKPSTEDKLALANYTPKSNRLEIVGTVKYPNDAKKKPDNGSTKEMKKKAKLQQRSRSDPRETRNDTEKKV